MFQVDFGCKVNSVKCVNINMALENISLIQKSIKFIENEELLSFLHFFVDKNVFL